MLITESISVICFRLKSIEIIDDSSIIITINSTLGYEALARGKKVIFFNVLPNSKTSNFTKLSHSSTTQTMMKYADDWQMGLV